VRELRTRAEEFEMEGMATDDCWPKARYVTGPPDANCYPTVPHLLCGWSDGLVFSPGCTALDASGLLSSVFLWH